MPLDDLQPPVDMDIFRTWQQVLNGANQLQHGSQDPEQLAQCISTLLARDRVSHKAMVGFVNGRFNKRTPVSAWIEFDNGAKLELKMPDDIGRMTEAELVKHLEKSEYRVKTLDKPLDATAFHAIAGMPLAVFRCFGGVYDDSTIVHTAVPKTQAREFSQQLRSRPKLATKSAA